MRDLRLVSDVEGHRSRLCAVREERQYLITLLLSYLVSFVLFPHVVTMS